MVIAIIGVLAAIVATNVAGYMAKARNTARISDVKNYVAALNMYYADNGQYPAEPSQGSQTLCCLGNYPPSYAGVCAGDSSYPPCTDGTNTSLAKYFAGLPFGDYGALSNQLYGYFYAKPGRGGSLFTIDYVLEGINQKCGLGQMVTNPTDNTTLCRYSQQ